MSVVVISRQQKLIFALGTLTYILLGFLAVLYYRERTTFSDISFHLFYILKDCKLAIQNNRFGAVFTQLFPLLSAKLHLPLWLVMINYSLGFDLYYAAIFFACFFVSKNKMYAAAMMLFSVFIVGDTFYWIQSELPQGIAFTLLFFAFLSRKNRFENFTGLEIALLITMLFFIAFFHPLLIFVYVFISVFFLLDERFEASHKLIWSSMLIIAGITFIKTFLMQLPDYDASALGSVKNFKLLFPNYITLPSNIIFIKELFGKFYLLLPGILCISVYYFKKHLYKKLLFFGLFFFGYLAMVNITHSNAGDDFYLENLYLPLSIFVIVPLLFDVLPDFSLNIQAIVLIAIVAVRFASITQAHTAYTARLNWERKFLAKTDTLPKKKLLIDEKEVPLDTLKMSWGTPYEFWLLSTIESGETRSIMITDNPGAVNWAMEKNKSFITKWGVFDYNELPPRYFSLHDTSLYTLYHPVEGI